MFPEEKPRGTLGSRGNKSHGGFIKVECPYVVSV